jgi:hypothetical protein
MKSKKRAKAKEPVFTSMRAFMAHYFPIPPKPKRGPLIILPRPSVGP